MISSQQLNIIKILQTGATIKECAEQLGLKIPTIYTHLRSMYKKLNVKTLTGILFELAKQGVIKYKTKDEM